MNVLLEAGADIHAKDDEALRMAATNGHQDVVDSLLKAGADVHADDDWALRIAVRISHVALIEMLILAGADLTASLRSVSNEKLTSIMKRYAANAFRGVEAVMMLDDQPRLDVLCHLHPELKPKRIREEIAMMLAMGLDTAQVGAMWTARHGVAAQTPEIEVGP